MKERKKAAASRCSDSGNGKKSQQKLNETEAGEKKENQTERE